jgi:hypothetical protein
MARRAATSEEKAGRPCQLKGLPFPGVAWDADGCLPGALIPAVAADPLRGERCPFCQRPYEDDKQASTQDAACAGAVAILRRLVDAARGQKTGRDVQAGRWVHLLAFYSGILPDCGSDAEVAEYLRVHPVVLSASKKRLPCEFQALCKLQHKPRKPHSP